MQTDGRNMKRRRGRLGVRGLGERGRRGSLGVRWLGERGGVSMGIAVCVRKRRCESMRIRGEGRERGWRERRVSE